MCVRKLLWQSKLTITDDKSCVRHWIYDRVDRACTAPFSYMYAIYNMLQGFIHSLFPIIFSGLLLTESCGVPANFIVIIPWLTCEITFNGTKQEIFGGHRENDFRIWARTS